MSRDAFPGRAELVADADGQAVVRISGDWILAHFEAIEASLAALRPRLPAEPRYDLSALERLDTAGAGLLTLLVGAERLGALIGQATLRPEQRALLATVGRAVHALFAYPPPAPRSTGFVDMVERVGRATESLWKQARLLLGFVGLTLETLARNLPQPKRWRMTALVHHLEQTGLDAVPIVALLSFLVGAVIAFLGATVLEDFGATIYTVDLVTYSFMREFGVLLAAILLAGRTASAFTAQIGSMKAREEIDAMRTIGLDPVELLVLPRVLALVLALPMLTFLATLAGIVGGGLVCMVSLDISPTMFLSMFQADTPLRYLWVGLGKAPIFAFLIGVIGCLEGFKVAGSAESVGERTTSSVVQAIFVVILVDALAALFFMEMGW